GEAFRRAGYSRQPSLPNAVLPLPFSDEGEYLESLSQGTRREIRRKLKKAGAIQVHVLRGHDALDKVPAMLRLYDRQRGRSSVDFDQIETLTERYFRNVTAIGKAQG